MSWRAFCDFLATGFYAGRMRPGPGTWGTVVGLVLYVGLIRCIGDPSFAVCALLTVIVCALAVFFSEQVCRFKIYGADEDPQSVVIDEVAGYFVAVCGLGTSPAILAAGFVLFRFFDILKPTPIRQVQGVPGGWGIVLDDLLAGLVANLILRAVLGLT